MLLVGRSLFGVLQRGDFGDCAPSPIASRIREPSTSSCDDPAFFNGGGMADSISIDCASTTMELHAVVEEAEARLPLLGMLPVTTGTSWLLLFLQTSTSTTSTMHATTTGMPTDNAAVSTTDEPPSLNVAPSPAV